MLLFILIDSVVIFVFFFFFSSRRRHTRLTCDWSSDVCSSDLGSSPSPRPSAGPAARRGANRVRAGSKIGRASCRERGEISGGAGLLKKKKKRKGKGREVRKKGGDRRGKRGDSSACEREETE